MRTRHDTHRIPGTGHRSPDRIAILAIAGMALGSLLCVAGAVQAQDALGDGRALDKPLELGRTVNPLGRNSNIAAEVAYRNALVTGNATNGMSFRESVGYNATFDFRTEFDSAGRTNPLPSNDIFNFLRDSDTSSYPSLGLRGIDALREQAAWSTGNLYDESRNVPILRRSGVGQSGAMLSYEQELIQEGYEVNFIDPFRLRPRSMRSSTEHTIGTALETRILGQTRDEATNQVQYLQSNSLRGVVSESIVTDNMIRLFDGKAIGAPDLVSSRIDDLEQEDEVFGYDAVVKRMSDLFNERYTKPDEQSQDTQPGTTPGTTPGTAPGTTPGTTPDGAQPSESRRDPLAEFRSRLLNRFQEDGEQAEQDKSVIDSIRQLYRSGDSAEEEKIDRLAPPLRQSRNLFSENMLAGEQMLADGRWFDAEERFSAALRLSPGDPMAALGRLHAQLGAGLYLSAGVNFDRLMRANPELMAARYDEKLLPRKGRLQRIDARLRLNTRRNNDLAVSSALLMAYLGFQFDDLVTVSDAFAELDRIHEERGDSPDILESTLREVWLGK